MPPYFVSKDNVLAVYDWREAIRALQDAYGRPFDEKAAPPRSVAAEGDAWLRVLPAIPPGGRYFGAKLMGLSGGWEGHGLEYVNVLFDRETHRIAGFIDANVVTGLRTAATSMAALDKLAPAGPAKVAVLGSGFEATTHVRALATIRQISQLTVYSPTPKNREAFAQKFAEELGVPAVAVDDATKAVDEADIVISAAVSMNGGIVLSGEGLKPGACIVSIGSVMPKARELDVSVVEWADLIICDVVHEVLHQTGDMIAAREAGVDAAAKAFSLNELLSGHIEDRLQGAKQRMFKSVGSGFQDIVTSSLILDKAIAAGLATPLPMEFETKGPAGKQRA